MASVTVPPEAGEKQPVKCAWPSCPVRFVPKTKVNKYCSVTCKRRGHAYGRVLRL